MEWIVIKHRGRAIGAVGLIDDEVVVVASFFDGKDYNRDGRVGALEWITSKVSPIKVDDMAIVEVAMAARLDERVYTRDDSFQRLAQSLLLNFSRNMIAEAAFQAWLGYGIKRVAGALAPMVTTDVVKQYVIKKGLKSAVKAVGTNLSVGNPSVNRGSGRE